MLLICTAILVAASLQAEPCTVKGCLTGKCDGAYCTECETNYLPKHAGRNTTACFEWNATDQSLTPNCDEAANNHVCSGCVTGYLPNKIGAPTKCIQYTGGIKVCTQAKDSNTCTGCLKTYLPNNLENASHCTPCEVPHCITANPNGECTACEVTFYYFQDHTCSMLSAGPVGAIVLSIIVLIVAAVLIAIYFLRWKNIPVKEQRIAPRPMGGTLESANA